MRPAGMKLAAGLLAGVTLVVASARGLAAEPFSYNPPGMLTAGSGEGRFDEGVYAPGMRFPIETGLAFLNSQVWGHGGSEGPGGGQCDPENRQYPWWDNYCETRTWDMPLCPSGQGHQGQDIRAGDCEKDKHWVVAATEGTITNIGTYSVYLTAADGTRFDYLHMGGVAVAFGDEVKRGDKLGLVSNAFGGTPTTIHLHFNIKQDVDGIGLVFVPPYMSLVASYQEQLNTEAKGVLSDATCERVRGASFDPDTPDLPNDVHVSIGGTWDDAAAIGFDVRADRPTGALCDDGAATCARGFDTMLPIALLDGEERDLHLYALDTWVDGALGTIEQSPVSVSCAAFSHEGRVRRLVDGDDVSGGWGLSPFFDELPLSPDETEALVEGRPLPRAPKLVASPDGAAHFIHDISVLRPISDEAMFMFRLDPGQAEVWSEAAIGLVPRGPAWPRRPAIARGKGGIVYLLDELKNIGIHGEQVAIGADGGSAQDAASCAIGGGSAGPGSAGSGSAGVLAGAVFGLVFAGIRRRRFRSHTPPRGVG
jgi:hypothetical protein